MDMMIKAIENDICGDFWTQFHEMLEDIEEAGYTVEYATEEYIEISTGEDEEHYLLYIGQANRTMWISSIREA